MNTKNYLFICLIIAFISTCAFGEISESLPEHDDFTLLGRTNPALTGIKQLYVFIVPTGTDTNENSLLFKQLDASIKGRFKQAGIKTASLIYLGQPFRADNMPELKINIEMIKLKKFQRYVFRIQTTLSKKMSVSADPSLFIKADVWKSVSTMQIVLNRNMPAAVTNTVYQQIETFIHSYLAANPKGPILSDANDIKPTAAASKKTRQNENQQGLRFQYVASKHSRVFHKASCGSAKGISQKNLVGFNSRDQATNSHKRPCKRCKP